MQRAGNAILRQIRQRFPNAMRQLLHRHGRFLIADQRQIDPALDICAQDADVLQALRAFIRQQAVDCKQLRLHKAEHRIHQPILFFNLRTLALQRVFGPDQLVFLRKLRVDIGQLLPDAVDF